VNVFADYYSYDRQALGDATELMRAYIDRTGRDWDRYAIRTSIDNAGKSKTSVGVTVIGEYENAGFRGRGGLESWPIYNGSVRDGLDLIDSFVQSADGEIHLQIHPRCKHLIAGFNNYRRKKVDNQWVDEPEDPQHPHEELLDSLRGGLAIEFPEALKRPPEFRRVHASRVF
jgi:hypothetical protein